MVVFEQILGNTKVVLRSYLWSPCGLFVWKSEFSFVSLFGYTYIYISAFLSSPEVAPILRFLCWLLLLRLLPSPDSHVFYRMLFCSPLLGLLASPASQVKVKRRQRVTDGVMSAVRVRVLRAIVGPLIKSPTYHTLREKVLAKCANNLCRNIWSVWNRNPCTLDSKFVFVAYLEVSSTWLNYQKILSSFC